jgi:hypothetical protein
MLSYDRYATIWSLNPDDPILIPDKIANFENLTTFDRTTTYARYICKIAQKIRSETYTNLCNLGGS